MRLFLALPFVLLCRWELARSNQRRPQFNAYPHSIDCYLKHLQVYHHQHQPAKVCHW